MGTLTGAGAQPSSADSLSASPTPLAPVSSITAQQKQAALKVLAAQAKLRPSVSAVTPRASRSDRAPRVAPKKVTPPTKRVIKKAATATLPIVGYKRLTSEFGEHGSLWSSGRHTGQDFSAATGTSIKAAASGQVVEAGWAGAYGYRVVIKHTDGRYTTYNHMMRTPLVSEGKTVYMGQRIGYVGSTGNTTGPHLHFEVLDSSKTPIGPLTWLRSRGVKI